MSNQVDHVVLVEGIPKPNQYLAALDTLSRYANRERNHASWNLFIDQCISISDHLQAGEPDVALATPLVYPDRDLCVIGDAFREVARQRIDVLHYPEETFAALFFILDTFLCGKREVSFPSFPEVCFTLAYRFFDLLRYIQA